VDLARPQAVETFAAQARNWPHWARSRDETVEPIKASASSSTSRPLIAGILRLRKPGDQPGLFSE